MVHLGNTYFQQGRYRAAIEEYQRYIQAAPTNAERSRGYGCVANVEFRAGNLTAAKQAATKAKSYDDLPRGASVLGFNLDAGSNIIVQPWGLW